MASHNPTERLPNNLDEAPEHLTLVQTSYALGMSLENVRKLEAEPDNGFPERRTVPFGRGPKFRRDELVAWNEASKAAAS